MQKIEDNQKKASEHGLGRGLDALIPTGYDDEAENKIRTGNFLPVNQIDPNPHQPRQDFDETTLAELAASIKEHGILQPLLVAPHKDRYQLIAGERRLRAAKIAGIDKVPVVARTLDEQAKLGLALIENIQRENLNPLEAARSYKKLIDEFNLTQDEVAKKIGKARSTVTNTLRLLNLPAEIKLALSRGKITEGHARALLNIEDKKTQFDLFNRMLLGKVTVRQAESQSKRKGTMTSEREKDPHFTAAEKQMSEAMETKVTIRSKKKGGQVLIDFYNSEDLERIFKRIVNP
jgi:ParB family chromosome partitioning protein